MTKKGPFIVIVLALIGIYSYWMVIKVTAKDRFDSLFQYHTTGIVSFDWRLIKFQALVESSMNPKAISPKGALGLMQLMPETADEMGVVNPFDVEDNLQGGIAYLLLQYQHFPEISDPNERLKFSLASYCGGRSYINKAISLAKKEKSEWQKWKITKEFLKSPKCKIKGGRPNSYEIINYVSKIMSLYEND